MATSRRRVAKKTTSSRTAQLEEKLDDLVSILRATQSANGVHPQTPPTTTPGSTTTHPPPHNSYCPSSVLHTPSRLDSLATAATSSSDNFSSMPHAFGTASSIETPMESAPLPSDDSYLLPEPTPAEAEIYLDKFRSWLPRFPFMVLPKDQTAENLRKEKPFLWLCIMNITTTSYPQQVKMKERVRQEAAQRVIVDHERSMDVLLGIVCYIAWQVELLAPPFIITFCQLAVTLVYDLSLMKAPIEEQYFTICFKMWGGRPPPPRLRTPEERRTVVSLWFLTSVYQLVADEAQKLLVRDVMGESSQAPTYVFRRGLLNRLQEIRDGLSPSPTPHKGVLEAHSLATEVLVNSVGLFMQTIPMNQRIESMYSCLKAIRGWYDVFFGMPPEDLPGAPFALYIQLSQIQVALYRLTTSEDPAWDKDLVRNTADLLVLLDQVIELFTRLDTVYPFRAMMDEDSLFTKGAMIIRNIRSSWEPILSRHLGNTPSSSSQVVPSRARMTPNPAQTFMNLPDPNLLDFGDITWMSDVFGPWEM
ncbi:uncharacterized protein NECHADRAFT_46784 [Fusarium vanettenii 77-13-4]|uniref:Transcription factor domain-containing protein n=1 Tax=Fusarium vanettenii (strain ATCC MYA-4622 / CBS 123669 / FGSC 9596 / NRRL 45880 / 77-13-4) TaxID=660122 RepID=C7YYH2_FUSV7|nr:uncharacterized protein NECHADRAFT_46784 [Fusarium vanettenii 77-13-4]EEU43187.1 hypothetical protein NECHADRAFT_46784 [Fusarium vanettenii 77-13-4]